MGPPWKMWLKCWWNTDCHGFFLCAFVGVDSPYEYYRTISCYIFHKANSSQGPCPCETHGESMSMSQEGNSQFFFRGTQDSHHSTCTWNHHKKTSTGDPKPLPVLYDVSELSKPTWKQNPKKVEIMNMNSPGSLTYSLTASGNVEPNQMAFVRWGDEDLPGDSACEWEEILVTRSPVEKPGSFSKRNIKIESLQQSWSNIYYVYTVYILYNIYIHCIYQI